MHVRMYVLCETQHYLYLNKIIIINLYQSCLYLPPAPSCSIIREFVKNGLREGLGVEPIDRLSMSGPESSPSQHDRDSSS